MTLIDTPSTVWLHRFDTTLEPYRKTPQERFEPASVSRFEQPGTILLEYFLCSEICSVVFNMNKWVVYYSSSSFPFLSLPSFKPRRKSFDPKNTWQQDNKVFLDSMLLEATWQPQRTLYNWRWDTGECWVIGLDVFLWWKCSAKYSLDMMWLKSSASLSLWKYAGDSTKRLVKSWNRLIWNEIHKKTIVKDLYLYKFWFRILFSEILIYEMSLSNNFCFCCQRKSALFLHNMGVNSRFFHLLFFYRYLL